MGDESNAIQKKKTMLTIPLNALFLTQLKSVVNPVNIMYRTKDERTRHRYEECAFLTQSKDKLFYTLCTRRFVIQKWENINFNLPYPLTVNLQSVPYKLSNKNAILEIPDCTQGTLNTFYDTARPQYIRDSDLHTCVVAINGKRANLEFINPQRFLNTFENIIKCAKQNPLHDWNQYKWFVRDTDGKIDCSEMGAIYKTVFGQNVFANEYFQYSGDKKILMHLDTLHQVADTHGIMTHNQHNGVETDTFYVPLAIFNQTNQIIIWQGIPTKAK